MMTSRIDAATTRHRWRLRARLMGAALIVAAALGCGPATAQRAGDAADRALISYTSRFHPVIAANGMVAAEDAIAAEVGAEILAAGGNAVDAAVAVGFAMAVCQPKAGNIGGGGFMIIALAKENRVIALDYREMAPAAAHRDMFLGADGEVDTDKARFSRLSAGVPGTVKGLVHALGRYGTLPLARVIAPAIRLAEDGFAVSYSLAQSLAENRERLASDPSSLAYFFRADGTPYRPGETLRQPDLANALRSIAEHGDAGFYQGWVADRIVAEMERGGGLITHDDLRTYRVVEREPVRGTFRDYAIASMPPPSSGGVHLIQMLNILEGWDLKPLGHNSADYIHRLVEAMRRAYADRSQHLGDPDFYDVPVKALTAKSYGARLRETIDLAAASRSSDIAPATAAQLEGENTTHFSVMDRDGNAVSNTYTLNLSYGGGYSVDGAGFLLNNEMDDFSAKPGVPNVFGLIGGAANAIEPGKRPLSSMTPVIVFQDGVPYLATGTPGGSTIITVVLQVLLNVLEFDMNVMAATAVPRIHHQWLPDRVDVEPGVSVDSLRLLEQRGFVLGKDETGRFARRVLGRANSVMHSGGVHYGAADPREPRGAVAGH